MIAGLVLEYAGQVPVVYFGYGALGALVEGGFYRWPLRLRLSYVCGWPYYKLGQRVLDYRCRACNGRGDRLGRSARVPDVPRQRGGRARPVISDLSCWRPDEWMTLRALANVRAASVPDLTGGRLHVSVARTLMVLHMLGFAETGTAHRDGRVRPVWWLTGDGYALYRQLATKNHATERNTT
ncbi:hypothetical protein [Nocardia sp. BMG51109]|uniref:hypothetical protein n=1 Tax=Nocardia sp. BMG51109 TaxID=1056816 RepID=UPI000464821A|nr:hypothetical protein [Nocardia sp. BMG51109]